LRPPNFDGQIQTWQAFALLADAQTCLKKQAVFTPIRASFLAIANFSRRILHFYAVLCIALPICP